MFAPAKQGDCPRWTDLLEVFNAVLYIGTSGCQWRILPKDFPLLSSVERYFCAWRGSGLLTTINHLAASKEVYLRFFGRRGERFRLD